MPTSSMPTSSLRARCLAALVALLVAPVVWSQSGPASEAPVDAALVEEGRALTRQLIAGDTDAVWQRLSPPMRDALGDRAQLDQFAATVSRQLGEESEVVEESTDTAAGARTYRRVSRFALSPMPVVTQWTLDGDGRVAGFFVRPQAATEPAPSAHLNYTTRADLRLPFDGEWSVFWGGRSVAENYHAVDRGQRFAYDLLLLRDGRSHDGDASVLSNYHCWGEPILAPADGTVVATVGDLPDQAIGSTDTAHPAGNHVVLDLGHGEYAFLAHLRQGSLAVQEGDRVQQGQQLGECGNSGNTSEPHLHVHLQDSPRFGDGDGLPAQFQDYLADDEPVTRGEPRRGQRVVNAPGAHREKN